MINFEFAKLDNVIVHRVGNKANNEALRIAKSALNLNEDISELLQYYFLTPFKQSEFYNFYHEESLEQNEVYNAISSVFDKKDSLYIQSVNLAKHLYDKSVHHSIVMGEFYVVQLSDCMYNNEPVEGIGLFKSETKEHFLKVYPKSDNFELDSEEGINLNKLDKGCIILNLEKEKGYLVSVIDKSNKGSDAHYWVDNFLNLRERQDEYFHTKNVMNFCKSFVTEKMPENFEVSKADQAELLNKSIKFFKDKDDFDMSDFANEILVQPEVIDSFKNFKQDYEADKDIQIQDEFKIEDKAVKKQAKVFKSIIKLDKNFHIYVHGSQDKITKGYDEATGMHFYQLYFKEEN